MFCRNCGNEVAVDAEYCQGCGRSPANGTGYCQNCGEPTDAEAIVCVKCGARLTSAGEGQKSKIVAGILGILVGGFGVHRFYLGFIGIGIVQIVVTLVTCGAGSLWGFIEGILILTGNFDKDAKKRTLKD
jgi:ribosomal protein L40E